MNVVSLETYKSADSVYQGVRQTSINCYGVIRVHGGERCLPLVERGGPPGGKRGSQLGWPELMGEGRGDEPVHTQPKTHTCQ